MGARQSERWVERKRLAILQKLLPSQGRAQPLRHISRYWQNIRQGNSAQCRLKETGCKTCSDLAKEQQGSQQCLLFEVASRW
jgi:hypothetical protein